MDVLGIDIGGTTVKGARVDAGGAVLATDSRPTPDSSGALTSAVVSLAESLRAEDTVAVGVACPGVLDDGVVRFAANLPWRDESVRDPLSASLGLPVVLCRDVAAAALAESARVTGDDVLFVWLGTGIAAAHVAGGTLREGATGRAGELGHVPVYPDGEPCACGQRGCLEAYSSAASIARRYSARAGGAATAEQVVAGLGADVAADAVWDEAVDALALALATDVLVNDPAVIVLGGGLAQAGDALFSPLVAALQSRLAWRPAPPLVPATLGTSAGQLGAAQLAWPVARVPAQEGTRS
jgi:glucokinase